jgi:light-regulated signal transduction histidine kinase (bacteriophytochrome)
LERRVVERTADLVEANRELEAFSFSVSHDLRAPLRHILGFGQALRDAAGARLDEDGRHDIERILAAATQMQQLIDALLDLSRVAHGEWHIEPVDLSALAREIAQDLENTQPERRATFDIHAGLLVRGNARLLRVVLRNLLDNAWKYTARVPLARIELGVTERDGERAYFVRDNGVGFDPRYAGRLFAPFQRLHGSEFHGTGVGLATVARIVRRHGGRIWAEAGVDQGATFFFTLGSGAGLDADVT